MRPAEPEGEREDGTARPPTPTSKTSEPDTPTPSDTSFDLTADGAFNAKHSSTPAEKRAKRDDSFKREFLEMMRADSEKTTQYLASLDDAAKGDEDDEDSLWGQSIVCQLKKLDPERRSLAKLKVQTLLHDITWQRMQATPAPPPRSAPMPPMPPMQPPAYSAPFAADLIQDFTMQNNNNQFNDYTLQNL